MRGTTFLGTTNVTTDGAGNASIPLVAAATGQIVTATATDAANNTSEFSACVTAAAGVVTADLRLTKQDAPDPVTVGSPLTYTITAFNDGPDAASSVAITDTLPGTVTFVSATSSSGTCSGTSTVTCNIGTIPNGSNATVTIVVTPTAPGTLSNTASVTASSTDTNPGNNSATATTTVNASGPLTFEVTTTNNAGAGSLRQAILDANAHAGPDTITFSIPGSGIRSIVPATGLPTITSPVTIDGTTQTGFNGTPLIELNGSQAGSGSGLVLNTSDSLIRGLIINRFGVGNGIFVQAGAANTNNRIEGNWVGLDSTGNAAAANNFGIRVESPGNTVGGSTAAARNVVSGNTGSGITVQGTTASGNTVQGNYVGTSVTGSAPVPNQGVQSGIFILNAPNNTIGGASAGSGNVISGNALHALTLVNTSGNVIQGNLIGTGPSGTTPLSNGGIGLDIVTSSSNTVGGAGNARNTVSNNGTGMQIRTGANDNVVTNNVFAANGLAIRIDDASRNRIGGINAADGNVIQNNQTGIVVLTATAISNSILSNSITGNTFLGIDIDSDGITPNDANDVDSGPNGRQNFPVLTGVTTDGVVPRFQGTLSSTPNSTFRLQFFASPSCDASGHGEGTRLLTSATLATDANGVLVFNVSGVLPLNAGEFVTATATDGSNNTSEFSACVAVVSVSGIANLSISVNDSPDPVGVGSPLTYSMTIGNAGPQAAANARVTLNLPQTVSVVSATSPSGLCGVTVTPTVTCVLGTLPSGGSTTATIVVTPTVVGLISSIALASSELEDPGVEDQRAVITTSVVGPTTTFTVTNTNNLGAGSLRQAILDANANAGVHDTIQFNIPGTGVQTITPTGSALPAITDPVTIDATSQPGFGGTPLIELNGAAAGATANGFVVAAPNSTIRGLAINRFGSGAQSGEGGHGILVQGGNARIQSNFVGTDPTGTVAQPNRTHGILVSSSNNLIGGAGFGNVVSGNGGIGVAVGQLGTANRLENNFIGTNATATAAIPNTTNGVSIFEAADNTIGGSTAARNVISGNGQHGVQITGGSSSDNVVAGNLIGTDLSGTLAIANAADGISIDFFTLTNTIGGTAAGQENVIAFNGGNGVNVGQNGQTILNTLSRNSIFDNAGLGINLGPAGVTANDAGDTDSLQNFPVLTGVSGGVQATLNSTPNRTFRIEFFSSPACDASGFGEGQTFLGAVVVNTDTDGNATIPLFAGAAGSFVTATATLDSDNTSEFSNCVQVQAASAELAIVTATDAPDPVIVGTQLGYSVTITNNGPSPATDARIGFLWNAAVNIDAATPSQGTCEMTPLLVCSFGTVADDASVTVGIAVRPSVIGPLTVTMTAQADESDPVPGNNAVAVNTNVIAGVPGFVVFNTLDSGDGSLRQAILNANARIGGDTIMFAIPGSGVHSIAPATGLPAITDPVILDATTQPGYAGTPLIELNGTAVPANGLNLNTGDSVIRGFTINRFGNGISVQGTNNRIEANWLGLNAAGTATSPNGNGIIVNSSGNTIGGVTAAARNVISGNTIAGVQIAAPAARANVVTGNYIGTDPAGVVDLGNLQAGLIIVGEANVIGGLTPAERNIISGNNQTGVRLALGANANIIQGNFIGTDVSGTLPLANGEGVSVGVSGASSASSNTIGGLAAGAGNRIAFNTTVGVSVTPGSTNNAIFRNSITGNGGIGIDLNPNGVTPNDPTDTDEGANDVQNFPVITAASGGVTGSLNSTPDGTFRIEFFGNTACDVSGNGEGATFLGATAVTTDANGSATIPLFTAAPGQFVSATATDGSNNTSEFSNCAQPTSTGARTWISNTSGFWEDAANWTDNIVPGSGDTVVIDRPGVSIVVTVQSAVAALASLRSEEALSIVGGSLTFSGAAELNGGLLMSGGHLGGTGDLMLGSSSFWTGGSVEGPGAIVVRQNAALSVSSPGVPGVLNRTLTNHGFVAWDQPSLTLGGGVQINNRATGSLAILGNLTISNASALPATFTNEGTLNKSGPGGPLTLINVFFVTSGSVLLRVGEQSDVISSNAGGLLGGILSIDTQPGFTPGDGASFDLFALSSRTGTFAQILGGLHTYTPTYTATGLSVTVQAAGTANLAVTKTDAPDPVLRGSTLTYTLTVTNAGPSTANGVTLVDGLAEDVTFVSAVASQGTCTGTATIVCSLGSLPVDATATVTITVVPGVSGVLINTAVVSATETDTVPANNIATITTTVNIPNGTFTVTNTASEGAGSLRAAIEAANASVGTLDTIVFNIPGAGPHTITPTNTQTGFLPTITDPIYIDGTSQPGYAGTPLIEINGAAAAPGSNGLHITASGNTVRGLAINRFVSNGGGLGGAGIVIVGGGGNLIERNFIGTDPTGTIARPNQADGIFLEGSANNVIGGASVASRNLLSGNGRFGLMLNGAGTVGTVVRNNFIGPDALGSAPLGNVDAGIAIVGGSQSMIGGPNGDAGNTIAFNGGAGVHISTGSQNSVLFNRIFNNGSLGINLGATIAVTPNDAGDNDGGANTLQNFPVLSAGTAGVRVEFNSTPNTTFRLEFFASATCDASGFGEGASIFTMFPVTTDANGNFVLEEFPAPPGQFLAATATNPSGNTSEFSQCLETTPGLALTLPDNLPIGIGRAVTATVALTDPAPVGGLVVIVTSDAPTIASIAAPGTVTIPQGSSTAQIAVTGENVGETTLRADAAGYAEASRAVAVTQNLVSTPSTLNIAFGQSTALPINIGPSRAPPGGLTLSVVSSNPSVVEVVTPQVTVPEDALSANATVRGNGFGTATVTVSNPSYSPSQTAVTSSGALNILQTAATLHVGLPASILTLRLESDGTPVAALNDLVVTLSSANSQCVVVPPSTTIPAGLVSATFAVSPGTSSTLPCTAVVTATSSGLTADTVSVTLNQQAGITVPSPPAVGAGLQVATGATLDASQHGGVTVTVRSTDPTRVLVSPDQNTEGTTSFTLNLPNGQTSVSYYVQGVEGVAASANVNVSAPGFGTAAHAVDVVPIGVEIINLPGATTTLSDDDTSWYVAVGIPCTGNTHVCSYQGVRAGASPFVVTLALTPAQTPVAQLKSDQPVTTAQTVTKPIQPAVASTQAVAGGTIYGLAFDPLAQGTTTVTVSAPAALTMSTTGSRTVTISGPGISVPATPTVGAGLQVGTGATLGASATRRRHCDCSEHRSNPCPRLSGSEHRGNHLIHAQPAERPDVRVLLRAGRRRRCRLG